jgi:tetratricopeptide (TPR) repeat protein
MLNFTSAITLYEHAIRITPNDPELLLSRALAYRHLNPPHYVAALQDVNAAIQANPTSWSARHTRGELMVCLNDYDDAEAAFGEAYKLTSSVIDRHRVQSSIAELRAKRQVGNSVQQTHVATQSQPESSTSTYQQSADQFAPHGSWTNIRQTARSELPSPDNAQATAPASLRRPPSPPLGSRIPGAATTTINRTLNE